MIMVFVGVIINDCVNTETGSLHQISVEHV